MPETVIKWLIHVKNVTSQSLLTNADKLSDTVWFGRTALLAIPILAVSGSSLYWGFYGAMVSVSSSVIWAFGISASLHRLDDNPFRPRHHFRTAPLDPVIRLLGRVGAVGWKQTGALFALWFGGFTGAAAVAWVLIVLEIAIHWAAFIMVVLLPLYWFIILIPLVIPSLIWDKDMSESTTNDLLLLSMAVTASLIPS